MLTPKTFIQSSQTSLTKWLQATAISLLASVSAATAVQAAEEVYFDFGPAGRSIPVSSLEAFAADGTVDEDLGAYLNLLPAHRQQQFQQLLGIPLTSLSSSIPPELAKPYPLSQWLQSPIGELALMRLGKVVQTLDRQNGGIALRSAMVLSAADPEGLSIINVLRLYPTAGLRINLVELLALQKAMQANIQATEQLVATAAQQSAQAATTAPARDYAALPTLTETPRFEITARSLTLEDSQRDRTFPVTLYRPVDLSAVPGEIPVVIMSHGYGDSRTNPEANEAAQKMAAYGFVVVLPEHVGSNKNYQEDLTRGLAQESFEVMDFINRPLDIAFLLDTLEQQNAAEFGGRLQLDRVGLFGHSFGGYTALATAGATVDFEHLQAQCDLEANLKPEKLNTALLLQCRALELSENPVAVRQLTDGSLADERIGFVMALAPVTNLFGDRSLSRLQMPIVMIGGAKDIATPIIYEQLDAFATLTTPEKYFYLSEDLSHTPGLTRAILNIIEPKSERAQGFDELQQWFSDVAITLAIAHGRVHLLDDQTYDPYLTAAYVEANELDLAELQLLRSAPEGL
ncbi:MAG: alpha/beta hydrolase [Cyanobacteria bacterium P01_H01_bin.121]